MKNIKFIGIFFMIILIISCNSYQYIHNPESRKRQQQLYTARSTNIGCDIFGFMSSAFLAAVCNTDMGYIPSEQEFKHLKIINPTPDTMYVNMLTDAVWKSEQYCDFEDVRIPPQKKWRLLVPIGINYNIYFGNTENPDVDELLEINTSDIKRIILLPGITRDKELKD